MKDSAAVLLPTVGYPGKGRAGCSCTIPPSLWKEGGDVRHSRTVAARAWFKRGVCVGCVEDTGRTQYVPHSGKLEYLLWCVRRGYILPRTHVLDRPSTIIANPFRQQSGTQ